MGKQNVVADTLELGSAGFGFRMDSGSGRNLVSSASVACNYRSLWDGVKLLPSQ